MSKTYFYPDKFEDFTYRDKNGEKKVIKHGVWEGPTYKLAYEAGAALEPFYFAVVDQFAQRGFNVLKIVDWYSMSNRSQEWGNQQMKIHYQIQDASQLMRYINDMYKSYVAIKKDYDRIVQSLSYYKKKGKPDELVLKGIWADYVDTKSGPASIAQATKNLQFLTSRDIFYRVNSEEEIDKINAPERVKNYVKRKLREYQEWKKTWKASLEEFKEILEERIKAHKQNIKLYKEWVKPMLKNIKELQPGAPDSDLRFDPNLLKIGSNVLSQVIVVAFKAKTKEGDKKSWQDSYKDQKGKKHLIPFVQVIKAKFTLRGSSPAQYILTETELTPYVYTSEAFYHAYKDWKKDEVEKMFEDLGLNIKEEKKEKKEEKEEEPKTFIEEIFRSFFKKKKEEKKQEMQIPKPDRGFMTKLFGSESFGADELIREVRDTTWSIYNNTKKPFGFKTWPAPEKEWLD